MQYLCKLKTSLKIETAPSIEYSVSQLNNKKGHFFFEVTIFDVYICGSIFNQSK